MMMNTGKKYFFILPTIRRSLRNTKNPLSGIFLYFSFDSIYASFSRSRARSFFAWFFAFMRAFIFALRSPLSVIHAFCRASIFALISYIADSYFAIVSLRDAMSVVSFCFISRSFGFAVADSFVLMTGFGFIGELIPVSPETLWVIAHTGASWNPRTRSAVRVREARKYLIKI